MLRKIIDFIYPNYCGICGRKINERYTCEKCLNILEYYQEKIYLNNNENIFYDKLISPFNYGGFLRKRMLQFKFYNQKYISRSLGEILSRKIKKYYINADVIIPVPVCKKRLFERGYNQSEYIAKYISEFTNIKVDNSILLKQKSNLRQSELNKLERKRNVENVYKIRNEKCIRQKRIILVDDIFTTGATINECSKVLKEAGAKEIVALTFLYSSK